MECRGEYKMRLRDRLPDWVSEDNDPAPDPEQEMNTLEERHRENPPEPYDPLEEQSGEEIARQLSDAEHEDRMGFLTDERFLLHHWEKMKKAINDSPTLQSEYGLDSPQTAKDNGATVCLNHEKPGPVREEQYREGHQRMFGHKHRNKDSWNTGVNPQVAKVENRTDDMQEAYAQQTDSSEPLKMIVCLADRDDCPTSKEAFYYASQKQYKMVQDKYLNTTDSYGNREKQVEELLGADTSTQKTDDSLMDDTTETQQVGTEPAEETTANVNGQDGVADGTDTDEDSSVTPDDTATEQSDEQKTNTTADNTPAPSASASRSESDSEVSTDKQSSTEADEQAQSAASRSRNTDTKADRSEEQKTRSNNGSTADDSGWTFGDGTNASDIRRQSNNTNNNSEDTNL
jgi:hypothetical protein